jgi:hypothetical protein
VVPGILLWGVEPGIWAVGNFYHRKSGPEGSSRSEQILGLMASGREAHYRGWSDFTWFQPIWMPTFVVRPSNW